MKKPSFLTAAGLFCTLATSTLCAGPIGNSNTGNDYIVSDAGLSRWSAGVYYMEADRKVTLTSVGIEATLESTKAMAYVGLDLANWLTVYATVGQSENEIDGLIQADGGSELEYGGGLHMNLLHHEIGDPNLIENSIRINAGGQITATEFDNAFFDYDWQEVYAYLTISIVNDVTGDKYYLPETIALFIGPVFSYIESSDFDQNSGDQFGYTAGLELYITESVSLDIGAVKLESTGMSGGLHVRF